NYRKVHGRRSGESLIPRWAPSNVNDTRAYATAVARAMGVPPQAGLHMEHHTRAPLVTPIIRHEKGEHTNSADESSQAVG
ncbi:structural protein, partial [Pseudomonas aeruginosa]